MWFKNQEGYLRNLGLASGFKIVPSTLIKHRDKEGYFQLIATEVGDLFTGSEEDCKNVKACIEDKLIQHGIDLQEVKI